jgi:hypothetical protein
VAQINVQLKYRFGSESLKGTDNLGVGGRIMCDDVKWIHLAQDRDQWRALVNKVMKLRVPEQARNFLTS